MVDQIRAVILAHDDLGHLFEASLMLVALAPILVFAWFRATQFAFWLYPAMVAAWYHGREKAQFEIDLKEQLGMRTVIPLWSEGWWPGSWTSDGLQDWGVPTLYAIAWAAALSLIFGRLFPRRPR